MKRIVFLLAIVCIVTSFREDTQAPQSSLTAYGPKESLLYRLHYGFVNAGEARIEVDPAMYVINNKVCYKTSVTGTTTGSFDLVMHVKDQWISYIDTTSKIPQRSMRDIAENNYRLKE